MKAIANNTPSTSHLTHKITKTRAKERTVIKIELYECGRNGYEHFSLTSTIYEDGRDAGGGCNHEHILELAPELALFAALHLSDQDGVPMYAVANGFYWFTGMFEDGLGQGTHPGTGSNAKTPAECEKILADHLRAYPEQMQAIKDAMPRNQDEFSHTLEDMSFRAKWKAEAMEAIKQLEKMTGMKFASKATRSNWEPLAPEKVAEIKQRKESGYYLPENVAKRDAEARAKRKEAAIAAVEKGFRASLSPSWSANASFLFISSTMGTVTR